LYGTVFASRKLMAERMAIFFSLASVGRKSRVWLGGMIVVSVSDSLVCGRALG
jgi:hypothetical protein